MYDVTFYRDRRVVELIIYRASMASAILRCTISRESARFFLLPACPPNEWPWGWCMLEALRRGWWILELFRRWGRSKPPASLSIFTEEVKDDKPFNAVPLVWLLYSWLLLLALKVSRNDDEVGWLYLLNSVRTLSVNAAVTSAVIHYLGERRDKTERIRPLETVIRYL